jgi:3-oxoadipate enol-lactonase
MDRNMCAALDPHSKDTMARHIPGPLYFERLGASGTPMLFIHSTPDDHRLWLFQTARFSAWYRTIAVDLAGYGRSPPPQDGLTLDDHAAACWEAVDRVSDGGVIIQGNSVGSLIAQHMAHRRPDRVLALVISGTGYPPPREPSQRWKQRYEAEGITPRHEQVLDHFAPEARERPHLRYYSEMVLDLNNAATAAGIIATNAALMQPLPEEFYGGLTVPTLIVSGTLDRTRPGAFELQKRIKGSELASIEGAGHACNIEAPADYDAHCIRFLTRLGLFPG